MLYVLLILSFFLLIYAVVGGPLPDLYNIKEKILRYSTQVVSVLVLFILTSMICGTPFAGIFWGILGWFLPIWIENAIRDIRHLFSVPIKGLYYCFWACTLRIR